MNILYLILSFNLLIVLVFFVKINRDLNEFNSSVLNLIFFVSIYAIIRTEGFTIFVLPFLLIILILFYKRGYQFFSVNFKFNFHFIFYLNFIWLIFFFFYYILGDMELRIPADPYDDFSVYSRIAFYNDIYGLENIQGFNNLFNDSIKFEVYHHFELWFMNMANWINSGGRLNNLFFVFFPLMGGLMILGTKNLLQHSSFFPSICIFIVSIFVTWPYDFIIKYFNYSLPIGGVGKIILSPKSIIVYPIIISLIRDLRTKNSNYFFTAISLFFYPLLIPLITGAIIVNHILFRKIIFKELAPICSLAIFYLIFVFSFNSVDIGLNYLGLFNFSNYPRVFFVSYLAPLFSFGIVYVLFFNNYNIKPYLSVLRFFFIAIIISSILWLLFFQNINSNQIYRNLFIPLFSLSIGFILVKTFLDKKYSIFLIVLGMCIIPFFIDYGDFKFVKVSNDDRNIAEFLNVDDKILFIPDPNTIVTTYDFVENMFMPLNTIFLINENLHFINTSASFPNNVRLENESSKLMLSIYRKHSPYYNYCGNINLQDFKCSVEFMKKFDLKYLIMFKSDISINGLIKVKDFEFYSMFKLE